MLTRPEVELKLVRETVEQRIVMDITLNDLYQIDPESAQVVEKEFNMAVDDHIQLIITDWTICAFSDYEENVELFSEEYSSFDVKTLNNYLNLI